MKEYEIVHEIFNSCSGNQMRDVFIAEAEVSDPKAYVLDRHKDKDFTIEEEILSDGSLVFHLNLSGQLQRYTFTEI